ncbi:heat-inducible transcriptional repressor HrcA [Sneathiella sp. CAU 1612]|uniref:Heat-inducible transcription repressor HrcA n=1 Tax=Sneathiella sedimenti TaxID=2816034 RepID=A0ABS3F2Y2_9PROT|nr:heat-inducible transcriptional repressor HrcA [Sneathiella sedimenti]MBO0332866.1 heat-inducible transcriptional repressor HrcA [Sneathiella sedimenti]
MSIQELNERSRIVFRHIVETYMHTGEPVGSRTLSRITELDLSPASIRNVMADLADAGLLYSPHTSAGRLPTQQGLRLFVDGILEIGNLTEAERADIKARCAVDGRNMEEMLTEASTMLSGLSNCASLVIAPKSDSSVKQIEFVRLGVDRALVIIVTANGMVENRAIELPPGLTDSGLREAANYLNAKLAGRTLHETKEAIQRELDNHQAELDDLTQDLIAHDIASWGGGETLIVRGHANLLQNVQALEDLEKIRELFDTLEVKKERIKLLELAEKGSGVKIFIGSENNLFSLSGTSMIISPYHNSQEQVVGAIGVIGPARLNYARIVPMVDYTAKVIGKLLD